MNALSVSELRALLIRARLYRIVAAVFAAVGLLVFIVLYFRHLHGSFFDILKDPYLILILLVPFLPASVLSWMATRQERKYEKLREKKDNAGHES